MAVGMLKSCQVLLAFQGAEVLRRLTALHSGSILDEYGRSALRAAADYARRAWEKLRRTASGNLDRPACVSTAESLRDSTRGLGARADQLRRPRPPGRARIEQEVWN